MKILDNIYKWSPVNELHPTKQRIVLSEPISTSSLLNIAFKAKILPAFDCQKIWYQKFHTEIFTLMESESGHCNITYGGGGMGGGLIPNFFYNKAFNFNQIFGPAPPREN